MKNENLSIDKAKIMLFLGAGASAAFGYPTTKRFVKNLQGSLSNTRELILLNNLLQIKDITDVEQILFLIESVKQLKETPMIDLLKTYSSSIQFNNLPSNIIEQFPIWDNLEQRIYDEIFKQYEFNLETKEEVNNTYLSLLNIIKKYNSDEYINIFTTNYDKVIEEICHEDACQFNYDDGFKYHEIRRQEEWYGSLSDKLNINKDIIKLFKLHGSLDWRKKSDGKIVKVGSEERINKSRRFRENILIYPSKKIQREDQPYKWLHDTFIEQLKTTNIMIVIGFSFRDEYINEILNKYYKGNVILISPNASKNFGINLDKKRSDYSEKIHDIIDSEYKNDPALMKHIEDSIKGEIAVLRKLSKNI